MTHRYVGQDVKVRPVRAIDVREGSYIFTSSNETPFRRIKSVEYVVMGSIVTDVRLTLEGMEFSKTLTSSSFVLVSTARGMSTHPYREE